MHRYLDDDAEGRKRSYSHLDGIKKSLKIKQTRDEVQSS